jgi:hypothetical protein
MSPLEVPLLSRSLRLVFAIPMLLMLSACKNPMQTTGTSGMGQVSGQVTAPPAQISAIGGFEAYRLSAFAGEVPVGQHATLQAFTLGGEPIPAATARTDAEGRFTISGVPTDQLSLLKATVTGKTGKSLTITGLVKPGGSAVVTKVSAASSIVAQGLMKLGLPAKATVVSQVLLDQVVEKLASASTEPERNPDLTGETDLAGIFQQALSRTSTLREFVDKIFKAEP